MLVGYYKGLSSLRQLLRLLVSRESFLLVDKKGIVLPPSLLRQIEPSLPKRANVRLEVRVNASLDSGIGLYLVNNKAHLISTGIFWILPWFSTVIVRRALALGRKARRWFRRARLATGLSIPLNPEVVSEEASDTHLSSARNDLWLLAKSVLKSLRSFAREAERYSIPARLFRTATMTAPSALREFVLVDCIEHLPGMAFPSAIHVALSNRCNLHCIMCPYHSEAIRKQHKTAYFKANQVMEPHLLERIIREAATRRANLTFGQCDEPLLFKDFVRWVEMAKRLGCPVNITTNGVLLTEEAVVRLVSAQVDHISLSLDAATNETYRTIRRGDFSIPIRNIRKLVQMRSRLRAPTLLRACMVLQEYNVNEQDLFTHLMEEIGIDMVSFYNVGRIVDGRYVHEKLNFPVEVEEGAERSVCSQLWSQAAIYPDGSVSLCCATTLYLPFLTSVPVVGNIQQHSLEEVWWSDTYRQIRRDALRGVYGNNVCQSCQIWHNYQTRTGRDRFGHRFIQNPYETLVYLDGGRSGASL